MDSPYTIALMVFALVFLIALLWQLFRWSILSNPSPIEILQLIDQQLEQLALSKEKTTLVDLGSGLGTTVWFFYSRGWKKIQGIEGFFPMWGLSVLLKNMQMKQGMNFKWSDYRKATFSSDPIVLLAYISPKAMREMKQWIKWEEPSFNWLVSHTFALPGLKADYILYAKDPYRSPVYFYSRPYILAQLKD